MRCIVFLATMLLVGTVMYAQILKPVKWSYGAKKLVTTRNVFRRMT